MKAVPHLSTLRVRIQVALGIIVVCTALITSLLLLRYPAYANYYRVQGHAYTEPGYDKTGPLAGGEDYGWIDTSNGPGYCVSWRMAPPEDEVYTYGEDLHDEINAVMYWGYPRNTRIADIQFEENEARMVTQIALWMIEGTWDYEGNYQKKITGDTYTDAWTGSFYTYHSFMNPNILTGARELAKWARAHWQEAPSVTIRAYASSVESGREHLQDVVFSRPDVEVTIQKKSSDPTISNANNAYSLEGAIFSVRDRSTGVELATIRTNEQGYGSARLPIMRDYTITEVQAPRGFTGSFQRDIALRYNEFWSEAINEPQFVRPEFIVYKQNPQGSPLAGAIYEISYFAGIFDEHALPAPTRTWHFATDSSGVIRYDEQHKTEGDELYYCDGLPALPLGTLRIREVVAPQGYILPTAPRVYIRHLNADSNKRISTSFEGITAINAPDEAKLIIQKQDSITQQATPQGDATLEGAEFIVINAGQKPVRYRGNTYAPQETLATLRTDKVGYAEIVLPTGTYAITETKAPAGYLLAQPPTQTVELHADETKEASYTVTIDEQLQEGRLSLQKVDAETGLSTPQGDASFEGAQFELINRSSHALIYKQNRIEPGQRVDILTTDTHGYASAVVPYGSYELNEIVSPLGYYKAEPSTQYVEVHSVEERQASVHVTIPEAPRTGTLRIQKLDAQTASSQALGGASFAGAQFCIRNESLSTIRYNNTNILPQQRITVLSTNAQGEASIELPYGSYSVEEIAPPKGYLLAEHPIQTIQVHPDQTNTTFFDHKVSEPLIRGDISFSKTDENTMEALTSIPFKLTSLTTGETHLLLTDENGMASTDAHWIAHSYRTNALDTALLPDGTVDMQSLDGMCGLWFSGSSSIQSEPQDDEGALPYDSYLLEELPVSANAGKQLIRRTIHVRRAYTTLDLGTIDNKSIEIETSLASPSGSKRVQAQNPLKLIDTVNYRYLTPGHTYSLKGMLIDKQTGRELLDTDGIPVSAETVFTPKAAQGTTQVFFTLDASTLGGHTLVATEQLFENGHVIAVHDDIEDVHQTVELEAHPVIHTSFTDSNGSKEVLGTESVVLQDLVSYAQLQPQESYTLQARLIDKDQGTTLMIDGIPVTQSLHFIPERSDGSVVVSFELPGKELLGKTLVACEVLSQNDMVLARHEDLNDADQTLTIPALSTELKGINHTKQIPAQETSSVHDTVRYSGLTPGDTYQLVGHVIDAFTGAPLLDTSGAPLSSTLDIVAEDSEGIISLDFAFDARALEGKTIVATEKLYRDNKLIAVHDDLTNESQTAYIPNIDTLLQTVRGTKRLAVVDTELIDTVHYTNLIPGLNYTLIGTLMNGETRGSLLDSSGTPLRAELSFVPTESSGSVAVHIALDQSIQLPKNIIAFEELLIEGHSIVCHHNWKDEDQTISVPSMTTSLHTSDQEKEVYLDTSELIDTVEIEGLDEQQRYTLVSKLIDAATGTVLASDTNIKFIQSNEIYGLSSGAIPIRFTYSNTLFAGKSVVATQELYEGETLLIAHTNLDNKNQTISVPRIETELTHEQGGHVVAPGAIHLIDTVTYENLIPGQTYTITGALLHKQTGELLTAQDGTPITQTVTFVPEASQGSIQVHFTIDIQDQSQAQIVAFESLSVKDRCVAEHKDPSDSKQTVLIQPKLPPQEPSIPQEEIPSTGDLPWAPLSALSTSIVCLALIQRHRVRKEGYR